MIFSSNFSYEITLKWGDMNRRETNPWPNYYLSYVDDVIERRFHRRWQVLIFISYKKNIDKKKWYCKFICWTNETNPIRKLIGNIHRCDKVKFRSKLLIDNCWRDNRNFLENSILELRNFIRDCVQISRNGTIECKKRGGQLMNIERHEEFRRVDGRRGWIENFEAFNNVEVCNEK